jgi:hypothetical protein
MEQGNTLFPRLDELESNIGVEQGFFDQLLHEDDWSFVIKLHAVFEAVVTHLLTYHFQEESLADLFARLELSNKTTGKIAFMKAIGWMGKDNRRYISSLSELRNALVHDVRNCSFDLKEMVSKYSEKELKAFTVTFSPSETRKKLNPEKPSRFMEISPEELKRLMARAKENPKLHIWIGAYNNLVSLLDAYSYSDFRQWEKAKVVFHDGEEVEQS